MLTSNEQFLNQVYRALLDREIDPEGKRFWLGALQNGAARRNIVSDITKSDEFQRKCKYYGIIRGSI